ncbi:MAG: hypothetical protein HETSPECPRED_007855 [Heterodermia speciosa]|uniref:T6SS Phospholipase effector Tle1-like catalytic domain-containing protein n=1 Tax=Heterodermia speciosa TaxID=116794 RepID=A0A8H3IKI1_9LECA|nr:MAG: hypothetical protein HETSPECPRED_007855 [Heterodermia speciosa]
MNGQPEAALNGAPKSQKVHGKLLCCFDGTGNRYSGDTSDTNIVKLYQKFDRHAPKQFHYYQPGIGTYVAGEQSVNQGVWGRAKRWWTETIDQGLGTSFDAHVIAGYRFIMRYHEEGDKIFIFGFSRGAFTARFLARMISTIGLLSKGNEEMVPFAYRAYQEYEMGIGPHKTAQEHEHYMRNFQTTFCRKGVKVHFLGLFDTVNSVGYFDLPFTKKTYLPSVRKTATHVRHAVSIDERRCKFKPALLQQDKRAANAENTEEDIREVFFPGNHGDIGGGWMAPGNNAATEADDPLQLSDIALEWMISELDALPAKHPTDKLEWNDHRDIFLQNYNRKVATAVQAPMHDILRYGGGVSPVSTFLWRIMEYLPIFKRLELIKGKWKSVVFPPNMCGTRDIYDGAEFHPSVKARMASCADYKPKNDGLKV